MTTDPTITIAGLTAEREALILSLRASIDHGATSEEVRLIAAAELASAKAERDALAAQLAKVRAELAAAPKVCAIHSYALEGPCMTCGSPWPGAEKALRQERIEGMEKMRRISAAVGCPNSVEEVVEAVAAIKSDLASERAHLAACRTRIAGLERAADERSKEAAHLAARVAELEARPVLTREALQLAITSKRTTREGPQIGTDATIFAQLTEGGPVTLPAQDAATALAKALMAACGFDAPELMKDEEVMAMRIYQALASLGASPTSPTVAPQPAEVFAGVSIDELCSVYSAAYGERPGHRDDRRPDAIRAVLARLEVSLVAPVDPEAVARAYHDHKDAPAPEWDEVDIWRGRDADEQTHAIAAMRATLTAAGIPVTPEVGK